MIQRMRGPAQGAPPKGFSEGANAATPGSASLPALPPLRDEPRYRAFHSAPTLSKANTPAAGHIIGYPACSGKIAAP